MDKLELIFSRERETRNGAPGVGLNTLRTFTTNIGEKTTTIMLWNMMLFAKNAEARSA